MPDAGDTSAFAKWKQAIWNTYPKFLLTDTFKFSCHRGLKCFTTCCADVNIFLTPYDILRMKRALQMTSEGFLANYTEAITPDGRGFPAVLLKMREDKQKTCPLVGKDGCAIYGDRPWGCRMYPVGMASPDKNNLTDREDVYFLVDQEFPCHGFNEEKQWTVAEWKVSQGVEEYERKGGAYKDITLHRFFLEGNRLNAQKSEMFYMACYDMDRFKRFVFDSSFLNRFDISEETIEDIKSNEESLLDFGHRWIRFSLFQENIIRLKENVLEI